MADETSKSPSCKEKCFLTEEYKNVYKKVKKEYFNENNCFQKKTIHKCQFKDTGTHRFNKNLCLKEFNTECEMTVHDKKKADTLKQNQVKIKERCICMNPKYKVKNKNSISCICYPLKFDIKEPTYFSFPNNITCNQFLRKKCKHRNFYRKKKFFNNVKCRFISNMTTFERTYFGETLTLPSPSTNLKINETNQYNNKSFNILSFSATTHNYAVTNTIDGSMTKPVNPKNYIGLDKETGEEKEEEEVKEEEVDKDEFDYVNCVEPEEGEEDEEDGEEEEEEEEYRRDIVFYGYAFKNNVAEKLVINEVNSTKLIPEFSRNIENKNDISLDKTILEKVTSLVRSMTNESSSAVFFGSILIVGILFITVCFYITTANCKTKKQIKKRQKIENYYDKNAWRFK